MINVLDKCLSDPSNLFEFVSRPFHNDHQRQEIRLILPTMKSNVRGIFSWRNEISFSVSCKHPLNQIDGLANQISCFEIYNAMQWFY